MLRVRFGVRLGGLTRNRKKKKTRNRKHKSSKWVVVIFGLLAGIVMVYLDPLYDPLTFSNRQVVSQREYPCCTTKIFMWVCVYISLFIVPFFFFFNWICFHTFQWVGCICQIAENRNNILPNKKTRKIVIIVLDISYILQRKREENISNILWPRFFSFHLNRTVSTSQVPTNSNATNLFLDFA